MKPKLKFKDILILYTQILIISLPISLSVGLLGFVSDYNKTFDIWHSFSNGAIVAFLYAFSTSIFIFALFLSFILLYEILEQNGE